MKRGFSVLAMAFMVLALSSCMNFDDNTDYVQDYILMGTVTTGGVNPIFMLDDGIRVTPVTAMPADTFEVGERYYLHFVLGDTINHAANLYPIKFYRYGKSIIKNIAVLPKDSTDLWNDQPISMAKFSFSSHYCNFFFTSFVGVGTPETFEFVRVKEN